MAPKEVLLAVILANSSISAIPARAGESPTLLALRRWADPNDVTSAPPSPAASSPRSDLPYWERRFKEVCEYDPMCSENVQDMFHPDRIAWRDFIRRPDSSTWSFLRTCRGDILRAAKAYGVDARIIVGILFAERTLFEHAQGRREIQDRLAARGIAATGSIFGFSYSFSIGPARMHDDDIQTAETMVAQVEHRKPRDLEELQDAVLRVPDAFNYAAALLRIEQDAYSRNGFDVSSRPEILASLYNLGAAEKRAEASRAAQRDPRPNLFGLFIEMHLPEIEEILKK